MFSRALIVVTNTLAYEVHWLRFQDLSLIGPARLKRRIRTKKVMNNKHLILHNKLGWLSLYKTLFLAVFVKFIHWFYEVCQPWTVSLIWDVLFILLPASSVVFCDTQCSLCSTGRLVFLRFIDSRVKFHGKNLFTLYKLEGNLWRGQFREDGGKQAFLIITICM